MLFMQMFVVSFSKYNETISILTIQQLSKLIASISLAKVNKSFTVSIFVVVGVRNLS